MTNKNCHKNRGAASVFMTVFICHKPSAEAFIVFLDSTQKTFESHFMPFFKHSIMKTIERPTSLLASTGFLSVALLYVSFIWFHLVSRFTAPTQPVS